MRLKHLFIFLSFSIILLAQSEPLIWNLENIQQAKTTNSEEFAKLIREADKTMQRTIATVMDKEMTPVSGSKHDYMSAGRYWWPDPTKPDGLPYIRKDGVVNSEIDKLDRKPLSAFIRSVTLLSTAFYLTKSEKYAEKAVENLRIWFTDPKTYMKPSMNYGQVIPGRNDGNGRGEGLIDTYSFVEMLDAISLLETSKAYTAKDQKAVKEWFASYLDWMLTSPIANEEFTAKNNHGTAFDIQVARYALFVGKQDVATKFIKNFPATRIYKQVEPNGAQPLELARTTAMGYSLFNIKHYLDMYCIAKSLNINILDSISTDGRGILKAVDFLVPYLGKPQSEFPYKQIKDWEKTQTELIELLYRTDQLTQKTTYKKHYSHLLNEKNKINLLSY